MISHEGHRQRILNRFAKSGLEGFLDYEIIELLLTFVIPRKDTKPLAKKLIEHYKTVSGVLNASTQELEQFSGIGPRSALFVRLHKEVLAHCLGEKYTRQPIISHRQDVENYLRFNFGMRKDEYVTVLFLNNSHRIIGTKELTEGTVNQCTVYPRTIIEQAISHGASSIILAHNHPGGSEVISESDWKITERIFSVGKILNISLLDHLIILRDKTISLREQSRWPK